MPLPKVSRVCRRRRGDNERMLGDRELPWPPPAQRRLQRQARCGATVAASANRSAGATKWLVGMRKAQPLIMTRVAERGAKAAAHNATFSRRDLALVEPALLPLKVSHYAHWQVASHYPIGGRCQASANDLRAHLSSYGVACVQLGL